MVEEVSQGHQRREAGAPPTRQRSLSRCGNHHQSTARLKKALEDERRRRGGGDDGDGGGGAGDVSVRRRKGKKKRRGSSRRGSVAGGGGGGKPAGSRQRRRKKSSNRKRKKRKKSGQGEVDVLVAIPSGEAIDMSLDTPPHAALSQQHSVPPTRGTGSRRERQGTLRQLDLQDDVAKLAVDSNGIPVHDVY